MHKFAYFSGVVTNTSGIEEDVKHIFTIQIQLSFNRGLLERYLLQQRLKLLEGISSMFIHMGTKY
jgi:hypothetical protein